MTAGGVRCTIISNRTAGGSSDIYVCTHGFYGGVVIRTKDREDHQQQRRCLQQNPEVRDTGIHLKVDEEHCCFSHSAY